MNEPDGDERAERKGVEDRWKDDGENSMLESAGGFWYQQECLRWLLMRFWM